MFIATLLESVNHQALLMLPDSGACISLLGNRVEHGPNFGSFLQFCLDRYLDG